MTQFICKILTIFLFSHVFANSDAKWASAFLAVSLGARCEIALNLKEFELRKVAFPFDWLVTPMNSLIEILDNDFQFFTDTEFLEPFHDKEFLSNNAFHHTYYDLIMYHESGFLYDWDNTAQLTKNLSQIQDKYERRIDRFRSLRTFAGKVFFIRTIDQNEKNEDAVIVEQSMKLKNALDRYFPNTDFVLIICDNPHKKRRLSFDKTSGIIACMGQEHISWMKNLQTLSKL